MATNITWHAGDVSAAERVELLKQKVCLLLLFFKAYLKLNMC